MRNNKLFPLNLQFFAADGVGGGVTGDNTNNDTSGDPNQNPSDNNNNNEDTKDNKDGDKTYTQADLNRIGKQEKESGKRAAYKALGFDDEKTAKAEMEAYKAWKDSQKTEDEKKQEALNSANTKANEAEERALKAEAKVAALTLGVNADALDDVIALALPKVTDEKNLVTVLTEMKSNKIYKSFFLETQNEEENKRKKGTGGQIPQNNTGNSKGTGSGLGARLASSNSSTNSDKKSSYFTR